MTRIRFGGSPLARPLSPVKGLPGEQAEPTPLPAPVKLSLPAYLLAALLRYRSGMTCQLIAGLLGVDHSTISVTTRHIADLLASQGTVITPGPHRIRTLDDLH